MSLILALETSGKVCSAAFIENGNPIYYAEYQVQKSHAEVINVLVDQAFSATSKLPIDISAVAVSIGPGSYTGLRIGLSSAKGFCFALDIPLITVDTLQTMASQVIDLGLTSNCYVPMIDARRMEVFTAAFNEHAQLISGPAAFIFDEHISPEWFTYFKGAVFFGDGMGKGCSYINSIEGSICLNNIYPKADSVGRLAYLKLQKSEFADLAYQEPFYLKPFYTTAAKEN